jgi:hypothetical protein
MSDQKHATAQPGEPFLTRWSRLKKEASEPASPPTETTAEADTEPVVLPPVESLTPESDFSVFMGPGVRPELRQAALKKLFADPHFNLMDRLDIYIDDYTKPDPIPASMLEQLAQFRNLGGVQPATEEGKETLAVAETECATATESAPEDPTEGADETITPALNGNVEAFDSDTMSAQPSTLDIMSRKPG